MRQRATTIIFAHKLLILLPLLVTLPATAFLGLRPKPPQWQSTAIVWVEQAAPNYQTVDLGWTPAGNQVTFLNSLIHTNSFSKTVLDQTSLAAGLKNPATADATRKYFWQSVAITSQDVNFMSIQVTMRDPNLAWKTAQAIVQSYQTTLADRGKNATNLALTSANDDLKQAEQTLVDAHTQLANYITAHPNLINSTGTTNPLTASTDVNLALLQQQVNDAQSSYQNARQHYLDIQNAATTGQQSQDLNFSVIDQPQLPAMPVHQSLIARLQIPLIGLVLGLVLGAGVASVLILTDRSVLTAYDMPSGFNLRVLGEVPELVPVDDAVEGESVRQQLAASAR